MFWYRKLKVNDGGKGSGNFGHKGRPGVVGGSGEGGGGIDTAKYRELYTKRLDNLEKLLGNERNLTPAKYDKQFDKILKGIDPRFRKNEEIEKRTDDLVDKIVGKSSDTTEKTNFTKGLNHGLAFKGYKSTEGFINVLETIDKKIPPDKKEEVIKQLKDYMVDRNVGLSMDKLYDVDYKTYYDLEKSKKAFKDYYTNLFDKGYDVYNKADKNNGELYNKMDAFFFDNKIPDTDIVKDFKINTGIINEYNRLKTKLSNTEGSDSIELKDFDKKTPDVRIKELLNNSKAADRYYKDDTREKYGFNPEVMSEHTYFNDDKINSKNVKEFKDYVNKGNYENDDSITGLASLMTAGGGYYHKAKQVMQEKLNSVVANAPETEKPLYRIEKKADNYRFYDYKVGDSIDFDSQHFTTSDEFAKTSATQWFGGKSPVLFELKGKKPFFDLERYVYKGKIPEEHEGLVAGPTKVKNVREDNGITIIELEYDNDNRKSFIKQNVNGWNKKVKKYPALKDL